MLKQLSSDASPAANDAVSQAGPATSLDSVTRLLGGKTVLHELSLQLRRGELLGLLGPSGSGKTTLVKLLTGMSRPDSGTVTMLGRSMPERNVLLRCGYMAQNDALYTELSARDNLVFFGSLYGLSGARLKERIDAVMKLTDLESHLRKRVSAYSGGMKRRLSLAIALLHEPELLLLDEPTVGIDPALRRIIWQELLRLRDSGVSILLTTHAMDEAQKCDRIAFIRDGRLTAQGSPAELLERSGAADIEEAFISLGGGDVR
ncbi:ABC transporter ATP-binding protein [Paenibacillus pasadenensis]|uniref:ABC transporter ATP-binding protein n=1 Tax=Paenibacillus pasadenensis TaxID=217090 RepID=UPI00203BEDC0|nr:ABC transporter ATP-binding protein [Paenibacillus pasadenensis]MCM3747746.1 ABC transporter ATP-binding protein [Paenibacillus pasadenensis]